MTRDAVEQQAARLEQLPDLARLAEALVGLQHVVRGLRAGGASAEAVRFDVTDAAAALSALESLLQQGAIQILVNNAGVHDDAPMAVEDQAGGIRIFFSSSTARGRAAGKLVRLGPDLSCEPVEVSDEATKTTAISSMMGLAEVQVI